MNRFAACLIAVVATFAVPALAVAQASPLVVQNAWMRKVPGAETAAVYLVLRNTGAQPVTIVGVRSPIATHVMIHETTVTGGKSQMRMHEQLVVAPGQSVALQPGGLHVMVSGFKKTPSIGQTVPFVLVLANGTTVPVAVAVRSLGAQ
ncbi:MAG TPA: copper chaperone PCu(A)C [Steroidobacteraceae bacterium]|nr:copper chaperone PCu(A)C [Steroidobacteraceae bacterium]